MHIVPTHLQLIQLIPQFLKSIHRYQLFSIQSYPILSYTNSHHHHSFIYIHLNQLIQHLYMHFVCIFNNYVSIYYLYICSKTVKLQNFYLSKNREFTDIDFNENINLLQNDRNFVFIKMFALNFLHNNSLKNLKIALNSNIFVQLRFRDFFK